MQGVGRSAPFKQAVAKPVRLAPETHPWYFHPFRPAVKFGPESFRKPLKEVGEELEVTWNPVNSYWSIWMRKPKINHPICQGWALLFNVSPWELDERVFARLYSASTMKFGSGKEYFLAVEREMEREKERNDRNSTASAIDQSMEVFDYSQIKNIGKGSKFSTFHQ